jgi:hypothetical protein
MLVGMDIPAAAGSWTAVAAVLGLLLLGGTGLATALLLRRRRPAPLAPPQEDRRDDLAGFLEHPPGTAGALSPPGDGWAALSAPAPPRGPTAPPEAIRKPRRPSRRDVPAATAVAALVLAAATTAAALVLAGGGHGRDTDRGRDRETRSGTADRRLDGTSLEARLSFGGVVLEPHAVGITATYPELRLTGDGERVRAHLELPTWNCLAGDAPADPVAAGCRRSVPEFADLAEPDLTVTAAGDGLRITGRFATSTRPNGGAPAATGRTYELDVTLVPGDRARNGWLPAEAVLELGGNRTETTGADTATGVNVLRYRER